MRQALSLVVDRHPILIYTLARFGLFLVVAVPMYLAGFRGMMLLFVALLGSGLLSLVLLNGVRSRYSGRLTGFFQRLNKQIDDAARSEDEAEDDIIGEAPLGQAQSASQSQPQPQPQSGQ